MIRLDGEELSKVTAGDRIPEDKGLAGTHLVLQLIRDGDGFGPGYQALERYRRLGAGISLWSQSEIPNHPGVLEAASQLSPFVLDDASEPPRAVLLLRSIDTVDDTLILASLSAITQGYDFVTSDFDYLQEFSGPAKVSYTPSWNAEYGLSVDFAGEYCALSSRSFAALAQSGRELGDLDNATAIGLWLEALEEQFLAVRIAGAYAHNGERAISADTRAQFPDGTASLNAARTLAESFGVPIAIFKSQAPRRRVVKYREILHPPSVAVVIPTRDHLELLAGAIEGIESCTSYPNLEVVVIDNDSQEPQTIAYLAQLAARGVTVHSYHGDFNYAAMHNQVLAELKAEYLCLVNNDIFIEDPAWLTSAMAIAMRPDVGVVGAKLLYVDRTIQHAGILIGGNGETSHLLKGIAEDDPGYGFRAVVPSEVMAVTGAAMLTRACIFSQLGGFDADNFAISFNDIDYCLRVRKSGYRVIFDPGMTLFHFESKTRGHDSLSEANAARHRRELAAMRAKWGDTFKEDPYFNPLLDPFDATFASRAADSAFSGTP